MARWLKTLFLMIVLSGTVVSGTPFQKSGMNDKVCPMKCCKKSVRANKPNKVNAKFLCRLLNCSQNMPTNSSTSSNANLAPLLVARENKTFFEILFSKRPKKAVPTFLHKTKLLNTIQPRYIQNLSLLI